MDKIDTGGDAYPNIEYDNTPGMTLLDYFAGQAMGGLISQDNPATDSASSIG